VPSRGFVHRRLAGGLALAGLVLSLALPSGPGAASAGGGQAHTVEPLPGPDIAARTPVARRGSEAAGTSRIGAGGLERKLGNLINQAGSSSGAWVADIDEGTVFAQRANDSRILASNTKLFTTATALDRIGAKERLRTTVVADGEIAGRGVLRGDLYLVGTGDPALSGRSYARRKGIPGTPIGRLAAQVKKAGVKKVTGRLFADDSIFDGVRGVPDSGGHTSPYIGPLSGLSYNENRGGGGFVSNPEVNTAEKLRKGLKNRGIKVGKVGERRAPDAALEEDALADARSATLTNLVEETNKPSNNFFAEMLLKRLDAADGDKGTTRGGAKETERFAESLGSDVHQVDGSGLTRTNRASPEEVGRLLLGMAGHDAGDEFRHSLPMAGREGTLAGRMQGTAAEGRCRAKTGTISGVSALSGYCKARGADTAFSILMNGVDVNRARSIQDRMAATIARYKP
jgi:D-alanyl-D-alanine carboxypeptidase/D-alanyl-D-alanine-endopeptidase (penicillin-binding protein 4)